MATFQDIRQFLENHYNDLVLTLSSGEQAQFQSAFDRLQRDWDRIPDERVKLDVTLREMQKYPTVWRALEDAKLVSKGQPSASVPASTPPLVSPTASQPRLTRSSQPAEGDSARANTGQPSQSLIDRMAIWDKRVGISRELVTNALGALIVVVTLGIAIATVLSASNASAYAAAKDVLLFMNGLVGVVLGYYFGRVPGDARADKAESEAKAASSERDQVVATVRTMLDTSSSSSSRGVSPGGTTLTPEQVETLRRMVYKYGE